MKILIGVLLLCTFICCDMNGTEPMETEPLRYLALGDSYTIGESVDEELRWPVQLVAKLNERDSNYADPQLIARTGWTTNELQTAIGEANLEGPFDLVSLLIGVNNQFRGYDFAQYEKEFVALLEQAIDFAGGEVDKVFVVSIPDYGLTPFGSRYNPEKVARELDEYNAYAQAQAEARRVRFYNITPISREAGEDPDLIAGDNLHPSGEMYRRWVEEVILPGFSED